jgi:putative ATPase
MTEPHWYEPVQRGLETQISEKMAFLRNLDQEAKKK